MAERQGQDCQSLHEVSGRRGQQCEKEASTRASCWEPYFLLLHLREPYLAAEAVFPEIYYKTKNIFPKTIASSELIILCIQLKESFTESTSHLPTSDFMNHTIVHSCSTGHFCNSPAGVSPPTFSFAHSNGVSASLQYSDPLFSFFQGNCKYAQSRMFYLPSSHHVFVHKTLFSSCARFVGYLITQTLLLKSFFLQRILSDLSGTTFFHNTVVVFPSISCSCMNPLLFKEQFSPNYLTFRSQPYPQLFRSL